MAVFWPDDAARYVEPFAGSACLFFHLRPKSALLSDINVELITFYSVLVDHPVSVGEALARLGPARPETYYAIRAMAPERLAMDERAARFLFLNQYCFNGLYRTDRFDRFNVPFGGVKGGRPPTPSDLAAYADALRTAELVTADFAETIDSVAPGDFVYLDPPYAVESQWRRGLHYTGDTFAVGDVSRLRDAIDQIDASNASFLLSYADSPEGRFLARHYFHRTLTVRRSIAGSALKRVRASELLISNRPFADPDVAAA